MKLTLPLLALLLAGSAQADEYGICSIGIFDQFGNRLDLRSVIVAPSSAAPETPTVLSVQGIPWAVAIPLCPKDREIVMRAGGQYGCAKDIQPPEDLK